MEMDISKMVDTEESVCEDCGEKFSPTMGRSKCIDCLKERIDEISGFDDIDVDVVVVDVDDAGWRRF